MNKRLALVGLATLLFAGYVFAQRVFPITGGKLTTNLDGNGQSITNASFVGDGSGLTNLPEAVDSVARTNLQANIDSEALLRVAGDNVANTNLLAIIQAYHAIALTNEAASIAAEAVLRAAGDAIAMTNYVAALAAETSARQSGDLVAMTNWQAIVYSLTNGAARGATAVQPDATYNNMQGLVYAGMSWPTGTYNVASLPMGSFAFIHQGSVLGAASFGQQVSGRQVVRDEGRNLTLRMYGDSEAYSAAGSEQFILNKGTDNTVDIQSGVPFSQQRIVMFGNGCTATALESAEMTEQRGILGNGQSMQNGGPLTIQIWDGQTSPDGTSIQTDLRGSIVLGPISRMRTGGDGIPAEHHSVRAFGMIETESYFKGPGTGITGMTAGQVGALTTNEVETVVTGAVAVASAADRAYAAGLVATGTVAHAAVEADTNRLGHVQNIGFTYQNNLLYYTAPTGCTGMVFRFYVAGGGVTNIYLWRDNP